MTTHQTASLRLPYYDDGDVLDWASIWQTNFQLVEYAIAGVRPLTTTGGTMTLSVASPSSPTTSNTDDDARYAVLACTGTLTSAQTIIVPALNKTYLVDNATSGSFTLGLKTASGSIYNVTQGSVQLLYVSSAGNVYPAAPPVVRATGVIASSSIGAAGTNGNLQYTNGTNLVGAQAYNYASTGTLLTGTAQLSTDIPLALVGAGSQSGNLTEWRNSSGSVLASVSSAGNILGTGTLSISGAATLLSTLSVTTSTTVPTLIGGAAVSQALTIKSTTGNGSSDAIIFQVGNNGATEAARFNTSGQFVSALGTVGAPADCATGGLTTGTYWPSTSSYAVAISGSQVALFNSTGLTVTGAGSVTTTMTAPTVTGGAAAGSTLVLESTTGAGSGDAIIFKTASQTEAARFNSSQQFVSILGAVGTPVFSPTGGLTSGLYWPSTTSAAFSISSTQRLLVNSSGTLVTGTATAATIAGGAAAGSTLTVQSTSGAGTTDAIIFQTASQTEAFRVNTSQQLVHTTLGVVGTPARAPTGGLTTGEYWTASTWNMAIAGTNLLTLNATGLGIKGTTPSTGFLQIGAGTTSVAPIVLTSGTNLTTAVAGGFEYDGVQLYNCIDTTSGRGAVVSEQYFHLTASGSNISTIANFFGSTSNISLVASAYYIIDVELWYTVTGGTPTCTWTLTNSAAPTSQNIYFEMSPVAGVVAPPGTATSLVGQTIGDATAAKTIVTGTLAAASYYTKMRIWLQNGTGTSLKIQATASTNSITPLTNSYWHCRRMSPSNIGIGAA